ncbi:MAG: CBS domain containing-hemolysin-like protein [Candidatus Azotimanducaceae bacterium]|jgi:CBS domain containing-hemolysin-like protein
MTIGYIILLLIVNAYFVAAEFALVKVPGIRIESLAAEGKVLARLTLKIKGNLEPYLAACQLGITMSSLGLGWIGEPAVAAILEPIFINMGLSVDHLHTASFLTGFILFSSLHIVIGEQVPKTYAIRRSEKVAMWCAPLLIAFYWAVFPINWLLNKSSSLILRWLGVKEVSHVDILSGAEISGLIDISKDHGGIAENQAKMLINLFRFDERTVHSVMVPRTRVEYLDYSATSEQILARLKATPHSRLPVIDGDWNKLKGVVLARELLMGMIEQGTVNLDSYLRPPQLVPESQPIRMLFEQMKLERDHMAFSMDEFGQVDGLVTLEDLLEEVVGQINDESDEIRSFATIDEVEGGWQSSGLYPLHDLQVALNFKPETPVNASTLSGFMMQRLQKVPQVGDSWIESKYRFTVKKIDGALVEAAYIELLADNEPAGTPDR